MKAVELVGDIDAEHWLKAPVAEDLPIGSVRIIVLVPEEDEVGLEWGRGVAREPADDLADCGEDFYTLDDGQPMNTAA